METSKLLLVAALGDLVLAVVLAVVASLLLRRFFSRVVRAHPQVARDLFEPAEGRGQRLYEFMKARRSRELNDPRAHALAFSAYLCAWLALGLIALAVLSLIASIFF